MTYDWKATLTFVGLLIVLTIVGNFVIFRIPIFVAMREENRVADKTKMERASFREAVRVNNRAAMWTNVLFYVAVLPFCIGFDSRPLWRHALEIVAVLLVFDFMYYWTHRSLFHGDWKGNPLRKIHALHHQARKPTYVDALYVHPIETIIGLLLFLGSIPIVAAVSGTTLNVFSMVLATWIFTQLNTLNHVYTRFPDRQPFRVIDYITGVHAAHHVDMNHGNFATLTMFYDKLFGTFEQPVHRPAA